MPEDFKYSGRTHPFVLLLPNKHLTLAAVAKCTRQVNPKTLGRLKATN